MTRGETPFGADMIQKRRKAAEALGLDIDPIKPNETEVALNAAVKLLNGDPEAVAIAASGMSPEALAEIDHAFTHNQ